MTASRILQFSYVAIVGCLTLIATQDPDHIRKLPFCVAIVLLLPAFVGSLPVLYVVVSVSWNAVGTDDDARRWIITATYVVVFAAIAVANIWVVRQLLVASRPRRASGLRRVSFGGRPGGRSLGRPAR